MTAKGAASLARGVPFTVYCIVVNICTHRCSARSCALIYCIVVNICLCTCHCCHACVSSDADQCPSLLHPQLDINLLFYCDLCWLARDIAAIHVLAVALIRTHRYSTRSWTLPVLARGVPFIARPDAISASAPRSSPASAAAG